MSLPSADAPAPAEAIGPAADRVLRGGGAAVLTLLLIATKWYGIDTHVDAAFGQGSASALSGWRLLGDGRMLVLAGAALSLVSALAPEDALPGLVRVSGAVACVVAVLLFVRVLVWVPDSAAVVDIKPGAYLALVAVGAMVLGARRSS